MSGNSTKRRVDTELVVIVDPFDVVVYVTVVAGVQKDVSVNPSRLLNMCGYDLALVKNE
jgi:hypothetical protein